MPETASRLGVSFPRVCCRCLSCWIYVGFSGSDARAGWLRQRLGGITDSCSVPARPPGSTWDRGGSLEKPLDELPHGGDGDDA